MKIDFQKHYFEIGEKISRQAVTAVFAFFRKKFVQTVQCCWYKMFQYYAPTLRVKKHSKKDVLREGFFLFQSSEVMSMVLDNNLRAYFEDKPTKESWDFIQNKVYIFFIIRKTKKLANNLHKCLEQNANTVGTILFMLLIICLG